MTLSVNQIVNVENYHPTLLIAITKTFVALWSRQTEINFLIGESVSIHNYIDMIYYKIKENRTMQEALINFAIDRLYTASLLPNIVATKKFLPNPLKLPNAK
jgi:hypothetical protein